MAEFQQGNMYHITARISWFANPAQKVIEERYIGFDRDQGEVLSRRYIQLGENAESPLEGAVYYPRGNPKRFSTIDGIITQKDLEQLREGVQREWRTAEAQTNAGGLVHVHITLLDTSEQPNVYKELEKLCQHYDLANISLRSLCRKI